MKLTPDDHARIAAAVIAAEATTDGEIVTIVAEESDAYRDAALQWAFAATLLAMALVASFPARAMLLADLLAGGWASWSAQGLMTLLLVVLALVFVAVRLILAWRPLRLALTPGATKARRVRRRAILLFRVGTERRTATATGVLLYLSLAERRAEIVADASVHTKVAPEAWGEAMAALVDAVREGRPGDGMASAVTAIGAVLAQHLPFTGTDPNELPDRVIEL